jgi:hypothetical protein
MRVERVQPKRTKEVSIPANLLEFFQYVDHLIKQKDDLATIESDDLIQTEFVYGGLIETDSDEFGFTFSPKPKTRSKWEIELTASEIADISLGKKKTLALWECQNPDCESLFPSESYACFDCDYVDDELDAKNAVLNRLAESPTREEWVRGYLINYPDAHSFEIIGAYNSQEELGKRWGYFSLNEMRDLLENLKNPNNS